MTEQTTTSRTLSAAQAAGDAALWEQVQRGEVRVTRRWYGHPEPVAFLVDYPINRAQGQDIQAGHGDYDWTNDGGSYDISDNEPLTITSIPIADQSPNSPAAVERLTTRVAELTAALTELYHASMPAAQLILVATDDWHHDFLTAAGNAYAVLHQAQREVLVPDSTSPASATDTPLAYVESPRVDTGAENGVSTRPRSVKVGNLSADELTSAPAHVLQLIAHMPYALAEDTVARAQTDVDARNEEGGDSGTDEAGAQLDKEWHDNHD